MSLERKDLRIKLDVDDHQGLTLLAESEGRELNDWAERVLVREIRRRMHAAMVLAEKAKRLGSPGIQSRRMTEVKERPGLHSRPRST